MYHAFGTGDAIMKYGNNCNKKIATFVAFLVPQGHGNVCAAQDDVHGLLTGSTAFSGYAK
jgi:hypothetical protein